MLEFIPIKHGGGAVVDSSPHEKFEDPENCIFECVQNALDAAIEKENIRSKTILKFHFKLINKSDCKFFNSDFETHLKKRKYGRRNPFNESMPCLIMEDFSTTGITGDPEIVDDQTEAAEKNYWYYFLTDFGGGDENKLKDGKKGGSEGEGRQTFMLNSGIATFFGLSIDFKNNNRPSIFGMSYFGSRSVNNSRYGVFSSFGKKIRYKGNEECVPITGTKEAEEFISLFKLKRKLNDSGTSIVIPFYDQETIDSEFIIQRLIDIYRVPIFRNELEIFVEDTIINAENLRSLIDAREPNPNKKMLIQDYFNFLQESNKEISKEDNFEIKFYGQNQITKEDIQNFDQFIKAYNQNKLLKLKLKFEINVLKSNDKIRTDDFHSFYDVYIKKYPSDKDNMREKLNDYVRGQMPLYSRRSNTTSMFYLVDIQDERACRLFKHAEHANHSEISEKNWKLKEEYKNYRPIVRLTKKISTSLYKLITSESLEEDFEATQDLFSIQDKGSGPKEGGAGEEEDDDTNKPDDEKITHIVVPPIIDGLKEYTVSQNNETDGTITLKVKGVVYTKEKIKKGIEEVQKYLDVVKKVDFSKYTTPFGRKQLEKMKKNSETFTRRKAEYDEFLKNKCTFYPRKIKIDAGFEGEGMKNPIKKYNPVDFNFGDENFKIKLKGSVKLISRKDNLITILADQSDYAFSINGFKDGIEDVRFRVRNYEV